jgi:small subunit ribosomal protein S16
MVKIRLRRTGAKKKPSYRIVVTDSRTSRDGRFIEIIGHYNPRTEPTTFNIHEDRVLHWLSIGAQPTDTVRKMLENAGTLDRFARLKAGEDLEKLLVEARETREKNKAQAALPEEVSATVEEEIAAEDDE